MGSDIKSHKFTLESVSKQESNKILCYLKREKNQDRVTIESKQNKFQLSNIYELFMIFWPIPISWFSFVALPSAAHTTYLLGTNWPYSTAATILVIISYHRPFQNAGAPCYNWVVLSPMASSRLCSWCQASSSFHDPFSPGPSTATEVAHSP